jgi:hypothetical protein
MPGLMPVLLALLLALLPGAAPFAAGWTVPDDLAERVDGLTPEQAVPRWNSCPNGSWNTSSRRGTTKRWRNCWTT